MVYIDKRSSNFLFREGRKTKAILGFHGRLYLECFVQSGNFTTVETGEASGFMKGNFDNIKFNAMDNAIYKHIQRGGRSGAKVTPVSYYIIYFETKFSSKRVYYKPRGGAKKGTYRVITRDSRGRIIGNDAYSFRNKLSDEVLL